MPYISSIFRGDSESITLVYDALPGTLREHGEMGESSGESLQGGSVLQDRQG